MLRDAHGKILRRLLARPRGADARRDRLEAELLTAFDRRYPPSRSPTARRGRIFAAAGLALAIAGACRLPAQYQVDMGARIGIIVHESQLEGLDLDTIVRYVTDLYPLEEFDVAIVRRTRMVHGVPDSTATIRLDMVGDEVELDSDALWDELRQEFPVLRQAARMEEEQLEATVRGTLGGKLSHRMLDVIIDRQGVEAARRHVLEQLDEQGLQGTARVEVRDEADGRRRVEVKVRAQGQAR